MHFEAGASTATLQKSDEAARDHNHCMENREQLWREFDAMARRPLSQRINFGFLHTYKPVLDDEPYRSFDSMAEYRKWCEANLPKWLGYARV